MYTCPHCNEPGISVLRKAFLGPAVPATCCKCGKKVGIPWGKSFAILIPAIVIIWIVFALGFEPETILWTIFVVASLLTVLWLKWLPLEKR